MPAVVGNAPTLITRKMGKPFEKELEVMPQSMEWARQLPVEPLRHFVEQAHGNTLISIGAGGSYSAAEFASLMHDARGDHSVTHTPLSFLESKADLREAYVLIYSAGGNNRDILATYKAAVEREPIGILIVCGRAKSKLQVLAKHCERTVCFSNNFPAGRGEN